jgi:hypothetical protein
MTGRNRKLGSFAKGGNFRNYALCYSSSRRQNQGLCDEREECAYRKLNMHTKYKLENLQERNNYENLSIDGKTFETYLKGITCTGVYLISPWSRGHL